MTTVWLDGEFLPEERARIPASDPGFLQGRGLFETLRVYRGIPFRLEDHVARLSASARKLKLPLTQVDVDPVIRALCGRNRLDDAAVRLTLSAGGRLLVTARARKSLPQAWYEKGAKVQIAPWRRDARASLAGHKSTSYFENAQLRDGALQRGCADALVVGMKGELLEGAASNLFLVVKGRLVTPRLPGLLPGITRKVVMELAPVKERIVLLPELRKADEAFLTSALIEILPVGRPGPVGRKIAEAYRELTRRLR